MDELKLMAEAISGVIADNMEELRKLNIIKDERDYIHKLGEITAYEDVLNLVISRMNTIERGGK